MSSAHEFALFYPELPRAEHGVITDKHLVHRIRTILRLKASDGVVLFSQREWMRCVLLQSDEKSITIQSIERHAIVPLRPFIDLVLPFLERTALEEAVTAATVLGVRAIILVRSAKSAPLSFSTVLQERLHRIMIAAAEQSKQYALPTIRDGGSFSDVCAKISGTSLFFHPDGTPILKQIDTLNAASAITVYVGPAGDLTDDERTLLKKQKTELCSLTPTILRSEDAVMVGIGLLRSVLRSTQL